MADQAAKTEQTPKPAPTAKAETAQVEAPKADAPAKAEPKATAEASARAATPAKAAARTRTKRKPARKPVAAKASKRPARKPAVKIVKQTVRKGAKIMNKQTQDTVETGKVAAEQFRAVFGDVNERAKGAMERSARIVEELTDLTRGNVEALVASSKVAARGVEALSQDAAEYSRKSFEEASATLKSFAEVKSATDFFRLQSDYARSAFDSAVSESARLSETVLKIAGEVAEPITSRYSVAAERVKTLAA